MCQNFCRPTILLPESSCIGRWGRTASYCAMALAFQCSPDCGDCLAFLAPAANGGGCRAFNPAVEPGFDGTQHNCENMNHGEYAAHKQGKGMACWLHWHLESSSPPRGTRELALLIGLQRRSRSRTGRKPSRSKDRGLAGVEVSLAVVLAPISAPSVSRSTNVARTLSPVHAVVLNPVQCRCNPPCM